jgi:ankyrin repeat protein
MRLRATLAMAALLSGASLLADEPAPDSPAGKYFAAARRGDVAEIRKLLDAGLDVNTPFRYGATALSYACDRGHLDVVKLLLERGARVDVRDSFYNATAFDWAVRPAMGEPGDGHVAILRLLLEKGAGSREAVLGAGADSGKSNLVRLALEGQPLGAFDLGEALAAATKNGHKEVVELLTAAGAKPLPEPKAEVTRAVLARYVGEWVSEGARPRRVVVELGEAGLGARFGGDLSPLGAYDDRTFQTLKDPRLRLTFVIEGSESKELRARFQGDDIVFKRAEKKP